MILVLTKSQYCADDGNTYQIIKEGINVIHCGGCGSCSNDHDIAIYHNTSKTLTHTTTMCAFIYLFSETMSRVCLDLAIGFTPKCTDCWIENIACTLKKCGYVCLKHALTNFGDTHSNNSCIQCDEQNCGPDFKECSGANRRRLGIITDIERYPEEICLL